MAQFVPMAVGGVGFDTALNFLKLGYRACRRGWNGRGMWLQVIAFKDPSYLPYIQMKTVDNSYVPWLASQTDLLAHDWMILDKEGIEIVEGTSVEQQPLAEERVFEPEVPYAQGRADPSVPVEGSGAGALGNQ